MAPPLSQLAACLAALPGSGVTMAHLETAANLSSSSLQKLGIEYAAAALHISAPADHLAFLCALETLKRG
jgi:ethanolamine utilization microcompartment shell protein EutS